MTKSSYLVFITNQSFKNIIILFKIYVKNEIKFHQYCYWEYESYDGNKGKSEVLRIDIFEQPSLAYRSLPRYSHCYNYLFIYFFITYGARCYIEVSDNTLWINCLYFGINSFSNLHCLIYLKDLSLYEHQIDLTTNT